MLELPTLRYRQFDACIKSRNFAKKKVMHGPSDIFLTHCVVVSSLYDRWATTFTASIQDAVIFMAHSFLSPYPRPQLAHCTVLCTLKKVSGMLFQNV